MNLYNDVNHLFFYDFLSPYSFLAWMKMAKNPEVFSCERFRPVPIPMGTLIHSYETKGPAEIPSKRDFLMRSWLRELEREKIKAVLPPQMPFNSLYALRLTCSTHMEGLEGAKLSLRQKHWNLIDKIFQACWMHGLDISCESVLKNILKEVGLPEQLFDCISSKELRVEIKSNIKLAQSHGVFGVPTWVIDQKEIFWGADCLSDLISFLQGDDHYNTEIYEKYLKFFT